MTTIFVPGTRVTVKPWALRGHGHGGQRWSLVGIVVNPPDNMPDGRPILVAFPDCDVWGDLPCEVAFHETELEVES